MRTIFAELQLALMLLTRLPAGHLSHVPSMGQSAWAFPVVGVIVGAIAAGVMTGLTAALPMLDPMLAAGVTVAVMVLITGGLHEDGLADLADGFGGGRDRVRKLEIMRDSRIGSYGTLALILVLGLKVQAIGQGSAVWALIAIEAASRAGLPLVLRILPAARSDGLGHGAAQVSWGRVVIALALGLAALTLLGGMAAVIIAATIALVVAAISVLALRQIGGQTGDVLGAMQALSACAAWIVFSAIC